MKNGKTLAKAQALLYTTKPRISPKVCPADATPVAYAPFLQQNPPRAIRRFYPARSTRHRLSRTSAEALLHLRDTRFRGFRVAFRDITSILRSKFRFNAFDYRRNLGKRFFLNVLNIVSTLVQQGSFHLHSFF